MFFARSITLSLLAFSWAFTSAAIGTESLRGQRDEGPVGPQGPPGADSPIMQFECVNKVSDFLLKKGKAPYSIHTASINCDLVDDMHNVGANYTITSCGCRVMPGARQGWAINRQHIDFEQQCICGAIRNTNDAANIDDDFFRAQARCCRLAEPMKGKDP